MEWFIDFFIDADGIIQGSVGYMLQSAKGMRTELASLSKGIASSASHRKVNNSMSSKSLIL